MAFLKKCLLFCIGGAAYVGLELLWRGYSHISMFAAGGVCFLLIGQLGQVQPVLPWPLRAILGAGIITMVELAAGLLVFLCLFLPDTLLPAFDRLLDGRFLSRLCGLAVLLGW